MAIFSVGTVSDYVDSYCRFNYLATISNDIKDLQRPWAFKRILDLVPSGSNICEIGAGTPIVADMLQKHGYKVTVVDPYVGLGHGPTDFDAIKTEYRNLRFIRLPFTSNVADLIDDEFDAIYSISVLEHLSIIDLRRLAIGISSYLKPNGKHFHAVDFVLEGRGADYHLQLVLTFAQIFKLEKTYVDEILRIAVNDPEVYFLSAEAHNRWRGDLPYSDFPMRKVISVQFEL